MVGPKGHTVVLKRHAIVLKRLKKVIKSKPLPDITTANHHVHTVDKETGSSF